MIRISAAKFDTLDGGETLYALVLAIEYQPTGAKLQKVATLLISALLVGASVLLLIWLST